MRLLCPGRGSLNKICSTVSGPVPSYSPKKAFFQISKASWRADHRSASTGCLSEASTERVGFIDIACVCCHHKKGSSGNRGEKGEEGGQGYQGPQVSDSDTVGTMPPDL